MALVKQDIEKLPAIHTIRGGFCPDVRAIYTTIHRHSYFLQSFPDNSGVLKVVIHQSTALVVPIALQAASPPL